MAHHWEGVQLWIAMEGLRCGMSLGCLAAAVAPLQVPVERIVEVPVEKIVERIIEVCRMWGKRTRLTPPDHMCG